MTTRRVCDGWDAAVMASTGQRVILHFTTEPTSDQIDAALASYEAAQEPGMLGYEIEMENGEKLDI